jgi:hypothetical protein
MDWKLAMEVERAALERLAVLLFALADLAERAGGRSPLVRAFVLWILFPAETMARNLLTDSPATVPDCPAGRSPEDAVRLALSLRSLADAFRDLSRRVLRCANDSPGLPPERIGVSISATTLSEVNSTLRVLGRTPHDTS